MRALPNLQDTDAMLDKGRRSVLMSARNDAAQELRDASVAIQSSGFDSTLVSTNCDRAEAACKRLREVVVLWDSLP